MKNRLGFVSNSSSSSFIVAINRKNDPCPHCGRSGNNIVDLIKNSQYCDTSIYDVSAESCYHEEIKSIIQKKIEDGFEVVQIDVDYSDETLYDLVKSSNELEIIKAY